MDYWQKIRELGTLSGTLGLAIVCFYELYYNFRSRSYITTLQQPGVLKSEIDDTKEALRRIDSRRKMSLFVALVLFCLGILAQFVAIIKL